MEYTVNDHFDLPLETRKLVEAWVTEHHGHYEDVILLRFHSDEVTITELKRPLRYARGEVASRTRVHKVKRPFPATDEEITTAGRTK
jgi:hypothetical protein